MLLSKIVADLDRPPERAGRPIWQLGLSATAAALIVIVGLIWFIRPSLLNPQNPIAAPATHGQESGLTAILANNHLVYLTPGATHPQWDISVFPAPDLNSSHGYAGLGHRVAASSDHALIYALPALDFRGGNTLVVVTIRD